MYLKLLFACAQLAVQYACILCFVVVLLWIWQRRHLYRFASKAATCWGLPILGILPNIGHVNNFLTEIERSFLKKDSNNVCIWIGIHPIIFTQDVEFINAVLKNPKYFEKSKKLYQPFVDILGENLVTSPFEKWKPLRDAINLNFKRADILSFFVIFNKARQSSLAKISSVADGKPHKLTPFIQSALLGVSLESILGLKTIEDNVLLELIDSITALNDIIMFQTFTSFFNLERLGVFYRRKTYKKLLEIAKDLIEQSILDNKSSAACEEKPKLVVERLLESFESKELSWKNVISESIAMIVASFETVANTLVAGLAMLATHPEVQAKLFHELKDNILDTDCNIEYVNLAKLNYLDLVVKEVLRLYPPFPYIARDVRSNTHVDQYPLELPKNLEIIISIFHVHRRADIWGKDAECFRPERFLNEELTTAQIKAYMPFSKGPRNCVGWRYAQFLLKVLIGGMIRRFEISTDVSFKDLKLVNHTTLKLLNEPSFIVQERM